MPPGGAPQPSAEAGPHMPQRPEWETADTRRRTAAGPPPLAACAQLNAYKPHGPPPTRRPSAPAPASAAAHVGDYPPQRSARTSGLQRPPDPPVAVYWRGVAHGPPAARHAEPAGRAANTLPLQTHEKCSYCSNYYYYYYYESNLYQCCVSGRGGIFITSDALMCRFIVVTTLRHAECVWTTWHVITIKPKPGRDVTPRL